MTRIFVNLPVKDLNSSMKFFKALGYRFNEQFTDTTAACLAISDTIYAMLLTEERFKDFLPKGKVVADAFNLPKCCLRYPARVKMKCFGWLTRR